MKHPLLKLYIPLPAMLLMVLYNAFPVPLFVKCESIKKASSGSSTYLYDRITRMNNGFGIVSASVWSVFMCMCSSLVYSMGEFESQFNMYVSISLQI